MPLYLITRLGGSATFLSSIGNDFWSFYYKRTQKGKY